MDYFVLSDEARSQICKCNHPLIRHVKNKKNGNVECVHENTIKDGLCDCKKFVENVYGEGGTTGVYLLPMTAPKQTNNEVQLLKLITPMNKS